MDNGRLRDALAHGLLCANQVADTYSGNGAMHLNYTENHCADSAARGKVHLWR
jgi:hypothetical protein